MAITGELLADFSTFKAECANAEVALKGFETGSGKVETALQRMTDRFDGRKVIQDATLMAQAVENVGGVSALTEAELARVSAVASEAADKLLAMGQEVPPGIQKIADEARTTGTTFESLKGMAIDLLSAFGIGFSVSAVVNFGKALIDDAGALVDLSTKTGVSIEQLQRFAFVGKQANVSVDDFASASFKLGLALEGGDKSVVKAVDRLGLSYQELRAKSPDDQFNTTIAALEKIGSETERNALGVALFGKGFSSIAAAVAKGYTDMAASATVATDQQIKAIDDQSDAWDRWVQAQKTGLTSVLGQIVIAKDEYGKLGLAQQTLMALQTLLTGSNAGLAVSLNVLNELSIQRAKQVDIALPSEQKHVTLTKEEEAAAEKFAEALKELDGAGRGWQGTLATINGDVVESIKYYLDAGVSQSALATIYGLTAVQVHAVAEAIKDAEDATREWQAIEKLFHAEALDHYKEQEAAKRKQTENVNRAVVEGNDQIMAAQAKLADYEMKESLDTSTYQIMKIWEKAEAEIRAFKGTETQAAVHADLVRSIASVEAKAITDVMTSAMDVMFGKATFVLAETKKQADAAVQAAQQYSMVGGRKLTQKELDDYYQTPAGIAEIIRNGGKRYYEGEIAPRDSGGPVSAGVPYYVGTGAQPELFIPSTSGTMIPRGGGGGGAVSIVNHFHVVDTESNLVRRVSERIVRQVKAGTQLGGS